MNTEIIISKSNNKQSYRLLCQKNQDIPIFSKDWWLDAVCGEDNWDVILIKRGGEIIGSLPFYKKKKYFFSTLSMPLLTPFFSLWIYYPTGQKYHRRLEWEKDIIYELIDKLPKFDFFNINFSPALTNWLPFYWRDFNGTVLYTYRLEDMSNIDLIFLNFRSNIKTDIRKASKCGVKVISKDDIELFYFINKKTFEKQRMKPPYSLDFIKRLDKTLAGRDARRILFAIDEDDNLLAAIYLIWDGKYVYYLMGGGDSTLRNSGAHSLLLWQGIVFATQIGRKFDFEGGILENVERQFRAFGALQVPYFNISKIISKNIKLAKFFKEIIR